ncbi:hypothetical protein GOP47_0006159 [Adiantum capillus-veneris]|uniref:Transmembrane protein n=1 Tax=Adiantum capillus-veneris TaxID=13818 RepID=A0A9D4ZK20_ADICA|nr:hypothetical protein GOP47_0006159 [Adiantum capillus-veneris]
MAYSPFALCVVVVVVCVLLSIMVASAYERAGYGFTLRSHVWKTCHPNVHHGWLLGFRIVAFLYCLSILIYDIVLWGPFIFEYYTQWSFTLLIVFFGVAICSSLKETRRHQQLDQSNMLSHNTQLLSGYPRTDEEEGAGGEASTVSPYLDPSEAADVDGRVLQILYQVALGSVFVTDVVYWTCIFPNYSFVDVVTMSMHGVNFILLIIEVALNNMVFFWFRGAYFFLYTAVFIFFTWIIHALGEKQWPYSFLDVSVNLAPLWYFCLCIVHFFAYFLVWFVMYLKTAYLKV